MENKEGYGKIVPVAALTNRNQRHKRRAWREQQRKCRENKKRAAALLSLPNTPEAGNVGGSRQMGQARIARARINSNLHNQIKKANDKLHILEREKEKYRKRWERAINKDKASLPDTPRTKTRKLLRCKSSSMVRRTSFPTFTDR